MGCVEWATGQQVVKGNGGMCQVGYWSVGSGVI